MGQWIGDYGRGGSISLPRYSWYARDTDRGINPAVHAWCCDLSVFRNRDRYLPGNRGAVDAAARAAVHAGLPANEHALRRQHAAREHAALACYRGASIAFDPFRAVCAVDPLPWRGHRCGLAAIFRGGSGWRVVFWLRYFALPLGCRAVELILLRNVRTISKAGTSFAITYAKGRASPR